MVNSHASSFQLALEGNSRLLQVFSGRLKILLAFFVFVFVEDLHSVCSRACPLRVILLGCLSFAVLNLFHEVCRARLTVLELFNPLLTVFFAFLLPLLEHRDSILLSHRIERERIFAFFLGFTQLGHFCTFIAARLRGLRGKLLLQSHFFFISVSPCLK